jgi:RHS repeat-associated protein
VFADRLGNVLSVADPATGVVSGTAVYDSFGGRTITGEAIRYGFTGREHDAESGLIHFRARAYDPATGQFLQRDPIGFAAGDLNLYAYVWNDPFNWTDPSGLASQGGVGTAGNIKSDKKLRGTLAPIGAATLSVARLIALQLARAAILPIVGAGSGDDANDSAPAQPSTTPADPGCEPDDPTCEQSEQCHGMPGAGGTQTPSSTMGSGEGFRVDVENPSPGIRPGQIHIQFGGEGSAAHSVNPWSGQIDSSGMTGRERRLIEKNRSRIERAIRRAQRYLNCD